MFKVTVTTPDSDLFGSDVYFFVSYDDASRCFAANASLGFNVLLVNSESSILRAVKNF